MSSATVSPLERTAIMNRTEVIDEIADTVGVNQSTSTHLTKAAVSEVCDRLGVGTDLQKQRMMNWLREAHPELEESRTARDFSRSELREIYASLCRIDQ